MLWTCWKCGNEYDMKRIDDPCPHCPAAVSVQVPYMVSVTDLVPGLQFGKPATDTDTEDS